MTTKNFTIITFITLFGLGLFLTFFNILNQQVSANSNAPVATENTASTSNISTVASTPTATNTTATSSSYQAILQSSSSSSSSSATVTKKITTTPSRVSRGS